MGFIYTLSDPRTGHVRYVGKTGRSLKRRFQEHRRNCVSAKTRVHDWIMSLKDKGLEPIIEELEQHNSPLDLNEAEQFYISYFRFIGVNLTNLTEGGEGVRDWTLEARIKSSQSRSKPFWDQYGNYYSTRFQCAEELGINPTHISVVLHGRRSHTHGFIFSFTKPANPILGPKHPIRKFGSAEYRTEMSKACGGKGRIVDQNGRIYSSAGDAGKKLNLSSGNISKVLNGLIKTTGGYAFSYL